MDSEPDLLCLRRRFSLRFVNTKFTIQLLHPNGVKKNKENKYKNGTLLPHPEAEWEAGDLNPVQLFHKENTGTERDCKPHGHEDEHYLDVGLPVPSGLLMGFA